MVKNGRRDRFWFILAVINLLILIYPTILVHRAESSDAHLLATILLMGCIFVLALADLVSILIAEEFKEMGGNGRRRRHLQTKRSA